MMNTHTYMDNGVERTFLAGWLLGWLTGSLFMTYCNDFIYLLLLLSILLFMSCLCLPMLAHVDRPGFRSRDKKHEVCLDSIERTRHVETSRSQDMPSYQATLNLFGETIMGPVRDIAQSRMLLNATNSVRTLVSSHMSSRSVVLCTVPILLFFAFF
ncbi:hypothetical protein B0T26DRAFT_182626 [Lasiosphaeria miniovina]|uniref:Uncharacterized protein n=1 Tax=Lasiosphaeria miniovina TaxID=1954250 RepID=A0AA40B6W6_9PEZI|nr:uncharacterized protein B0T26DRAFT_182626 [Lasiosphaeria miniovina]KAK0728702.1 hypothetical protein B0T26DRAFT_182626 [Lasiosphaeria miniovina]